MSFTSFGIGSGTKKPKVSLQASSLAAFSDPTYEQSTIDQPTSPRQRKRAADDMQALGSERAEAQDFSGAIKFWNQALSLCPNRSKLHEMKSQVFLEIGQDWEAVQSASRAVEEDPNWSDAHVTLGRAQLALGEPEAALKEMEKALKLKPDHPEASEEIGSLQILVLSRQQDPHSTGQRLKIL